MSETTYSLSPFRETNQSHQTWRITLDEKYERYESTVNGNRWIRKYITIRTFSRPVTGVWLTPTFNDLVQIAADHGLDASRFLEVEVHAAQNVTVIPDLAFGFSTDRREVPDTMSKFES